jgi:hypothetical protein
MRFGIFAFIFVSFVLLLLAGSTLGDVIYLKDGSAIKGTLVKVQNDTLYFKTSFGTIIHIAREKVQRIGMSDSVVAASPAPAVTPPVDNRPGTLLVDFQGFTMSSRISVHRDKNRSAHERANVIEQALFVNGKQMSSHRDSTTDKVVKKGIEVELDNKMKPVPIKVAVAPGAVACEVMFANTWAGDYEDRFVKGPIEKSLIVDALVINPGQTTHLRVGLKKKKLGLAGSVLYAVR